MKNLKMMTAGLCVLAVCSCATKTGTGALIGTGAGTAVGAIIGKIAGNTAVGAAIGAAVGAGTGAIIGKHMDKVAAEAAKVENAKVEEVTDATKSELEKVKKFTDKHYAKANPQMFGIAKGRNVIVIHLESFQQFIIDKKINGQEVTPFLNSLYHSNDTYAFDNFFHQVGQGIHSE